MRTTVKIEDQLLAAAKARAASSGRTLDAVIEDALRAELVRQEGPDRPSGPELPVFRGGQLQPGVDLDDSAGLLDLMES